MSKNIRVSVITRTMNRNIFLDRCFNSVNQALTADDEWLVVDDAKDSVGTKSQVKNFQKKSSFSIRYISSASNNRSKAFNTGLEKSKGTYIHILDDDDTISPDFYQKLCSFLSDRGSRYGAVASLSQCIFEEVSGHEIKEILRRDHYSELRHISFANIALNQKTPPCSILLKRISIGDLKMDETFEVAEDYDYLLRFMLNHNIGVMPEKLAYFHRRESTSGSLANSAISNNNEEETVLFRNALMRRDLKHGVIGLGFLLTLAEMQSGSMKLDQIMKRLYSFSFIKKAYQIFRR